MSGNGEPILVTGGTGRQGGAVAAELLRRGREVRALVRSPQAPAARALAAAGAALAQGDLDDPASLDAAVRGAGGVFSVQTFQGPGGVAAEERQGKALAAAAARAGVAHLVYSSVGGAERATGVPHFDSKWHIEQHIAALGLPATVLRPAMFYDNFHYIGPHLVDGKLVLGLWLRPEKPLQMIAAADIAAFAADAFDDPAAWAGRQVEIAGDELTGPQMAEVFTRVSGIPARYEQQPIAQLRESSAETAAMFGWLDREGYQADLPALRRLRPALTSLESWLRAAGWTPAAPDSR
jgi:uncharacterized protein YbjT (DUF2867 family)